MSAEKESLLRYGLPPLLTVKQASEILNNMPTRTVQSLCERGDLFAVKCGRQWRINRDWLLAKYGLLRIKKDEKPCLCTQ